MIPTGLIGGATNISGQVSPTDAIARRIRTRNDAMFVALQSTQPPKLKNVLKIINQQAASQSNSGPAKDLTENNHHLNYDLSLLHELVQKHSVRKVVLCFQGIEGFQETILQELIDIIR